MTNSPSEASPTMTDAQDLPSAGEHREALEAARRLTERAHNALASHFLNQTMDGHSVRRLIEDMGAALLSLSSRNTEMEGALREIRRTTLVEKTDEIARRALEEPHEQG